MTPPNRTENLKKYAPYVYLCKGTNENENTYELFILIPIYKGEKVAKVCLDYCLGNTKKETKLVYEFSDTNYDTPVEQIFEPFKESLTPALHGCPFDENDEEFIIDIIVKRNSEELRTKLIYNNSDDHQGSTGNVILNAPYAYLTAPGLPDSKEMYPYLLIPKGYSNLEEEPPITNTDPTLIHMINLSGNTTTPGSVITSADCFIPPKINSETYNKNSNNLDGHLEVWVAEPTKIILPINNDKKKVKIRNKNSDNKTNKKKK